MDSLMIVGGIIVVALIMLAGMYNGHINRRNQVDLAFAAVDVQLKKRWDLVPNLVDTVKAYAAHEKETLTAVVAARTEAMRADSDSQQRFNSEREIARLVPSLMAISESYPELKANGQFLNLQRTLTEIEAQISAARRTYNSSIMEYNNGVQMFPSNIVAGAFGFQARQALEIPHSERQVRNVSI